MIDFLSSKTKKCFSRHLKWHEPKFNDTLNDTRFGLRARVNHKDVL